MPSVHVIAGVLLPVPVGPKLEPAQLVDVPLVEAVDRNIAQKPGRPVLMSDVISAAWGFHIPTWG